jgi:hypothetical protein
MFSKKVLVVILIGSIAVYQTLNFTTEVDLVHTNHILPPIFAQTSHKLPPMIAQTSHKLPPIIVQTLFTKHSEQIGRLYNFS